MLTKLNETEIRVLACLVEKELTTPDHYPLTLNSLLSACNQKSNREPVFEYSESQVEKALDALRQKNLVYVFYGSSGRVPKYKHMLPTYYELEPSEVAVVTVLMLRGPQTAGELNQRTGRLYEFSGLGEVNETLDGLADRSEPLIRKLGRMPGQKEVRYVHLLSEDEFDESEYVSRMETASHSRSHGSGLQEEVEKLRQELDALREEFDRFRSQFD
jgi:uncharacterized protein YceH (UPF0502 family)